MIMINTQHVFHNELKQTKKQKKKLAWHDLTLTLKRTQIETDGKYGASTCIASIAISGRLAFPLLLLFLYQGGINIFPDNK